MKKIKNSYLFRNIAIVTTFDFVSKVISLITTVVLIRLLSKNDYGYFTIFQSFSGFLLSAISGGIVASYIRHASENFSRETKESKDYLFSINRKLLVLTFGVILVLVIFSHTAIENFLFQKTGHLDILVISVLYGLLFSVNKLQIAVLQSKDLFRQAGLAQNVKNIALILLVLLLFVLPASIINVLIIHLLSAIIAFVILNKVVKRKVEVVNETGIIKPLIRNGKYLLSSSWLIAYYFFLGLFSKIDVFVITKYLSISQVAFYGVSFKYYSILITLLPSIKSVLRVRTSKVDMVSNIVKQKEFSYTWIKKSTPIMVVLAIVSIFISPPILRILNGSEYEMSILPFQILSVGACLSYIFAPIVDVLRSMNRYKTLAILGGLALLLNLVLNIMYVPKYGIAAAALTTVISHTLINIISTIIVLKQKE